MSRTDQEQAQLDAALNRGNADEIYTVLVGQAGLFGKAFYGHKRSKAEAKRLARMWKMAVANSQRIPEEPTTLHDMEKDLNMEEIVLAPGGAEPADFDNAQPRCDLCGLAQAREGEDWNGETGNHFSCEEREGDPFPDDIG